MKIVIKFEEESRIIILTFTEVVSKVFSGDVKLYISFRLVLS
jgi:hypothetical protein